MNYSKSSHKLHDPDFAGRVHTGICKTRSRKYPERRPGQMLWLPVSVASARHPRLPLVRRFPPRLRKQATGRDKRGEAVGPHLLVAAIVQQNIAASMAALILVNAALHAGDYGVRLVGSQS